MINARLAAIINGVTYGNVPTNVVIGSDLTSAIATVTPLSRNLIAGAGLTGGGTLAADRTFNVGANADGSIVVNVDDIQVGVLATDAQHGNRGGAALHALVTTSVAGFMSAADKVKLDGISAGTVPSARQVIAGAGLTGGGDLSADRTFNVGANADGSITVNADDIQVGILATDAQHGTRGGGTLHAVATTSTAGFMSAADKTSFNTATFIVQSTTNAPPAAFSLGTLTTGVLQHTQTGGTSTPTSLNMSTGLIPFGLSGVLTQSLNLQYVSGSFLSVAGTGVFSALSAGGIVRAVASSGSLAIATAGTDYALPSITLTAGAGLTGGGDLSANRSFDVVAADATITVNANSIQVGTIGTGNIDTHAVANGQLAQAPALSVKGNPTNATADVQDIAATTNLQFLGVHSNVISWNVLATTDLPNQVVLPTYITRNSTGNFPVNGFSLGSLTQGVLQQTITAGSAFLATVNFTANNIAVGAASGGGITQDSHLTWTPGTPGHLHVDGTQTVTGTTLFSANMTVTAAITIAGGNIVINGVDDTSRFFLGEPVGARDGVSMLVGGASLTAGHDYVDWRTSSTPLVSGTTYDRIFTHRFRAQTLTLSSGSYTITDGNPATVVIDDAPQVPLGSTTILVPCALRIKNSDIRLDTGAVFAPGGLYASFSSRGFNQFTAEFGSTTIHGSLVGTGSVNATGDISGQANVNAWGGGGFVSKPTVTGSRGSNAALTSALGILAAYGFFNNSSTP